MIKEDFDKDSEDVELGAISPIENQPIKFEEEEILLQIPNDLKEETVSNNEKAILNPLTDKEKYVENKEDNDKQTKSKSRLNTQSDTKTLKCHAAPTSVDSPSVPRSKLRKSVKNDRSSESVSKPNKSKSERKK